MGYSEGHPVRLVGGRLALDFVNTADWSEDGTVLHEKMGTADDLCVWMEAVRLDLVAPLPPISVVLSFRAELRTAFLSRKSGPNAWAVATSLLDTVGGVTDRPGFLGLVALSSCSLLLDRNEVERIKVCPALDCGWLFVDETGNGKRRWCSMEICGNRMKARRHYHRSKL